MGLFSKLFHHKPPDVPELLARRADRLVLKSATDLEDTNLEFPPKALTYATGPTWQLPVDPALWPGH